MITPEMFATFDWSEDARRRYYARMVNIVKQTGDLLHTMSTATHTDRYLDMGLGTRDRIFWFPLIRPVGEDILPQVGGRRGPLVDYLTEWVAGIMHHATAELMEMDARYPELRQLKGSELMPAEMVYRRIRPLNWLKRVLRSIFRTD
jgi:hypothetical protein